jgi:hypothetical protein
VLCIDGIKDPQRIAPSDTRPNIRAGAAVLLVTAPGDLSLLHACGTVVEFRAIASGILLPAAGWERVNMTDTTASVFDAFAP